MRRKVRRRNLQDMTEKRAGFEKRQRPPRLLERRVSGYIRYVKYRKKVL